MTKGQLTVQNPLVDDVRRFFAIKFIAASARIHCAAAIFHHKLVTTQVAECSRSFSLSLPLGEGRGEGSPMAIPGTELLSGFSNLERRAVGTELSWTHYRNLLREVHEQARHCYIKVHAAAGDLR